MRNKIYLLTIAGLFALPEARAADLDKVSPTVSQHRRPVAAGLLDRETAVVANGRSGSLSVIDVKRFSVVAEFDIQGQLTDMAVHEHGLLLTDAQGDRLMSVEVDRSSARIQWELPMPTHPASVCISPDGRWCSVCSLWARKITFVRLPKASDRFDRPQVIATVDVPFAPREQLLLEDSSRLIVADAFGSRLAVVRLDSHKVETVHRLPAQNIRGLALSPDGKRLFVSHQLLNHLTPPRRSDIIWGNMLSDGLRAIRLNHLLDPQADILSGSRFIPIGRGPQGAGDPDAIVVGDDGRLVIALSGTQEVAVVAADGSDVRRAKVGRRPVDLLAVGEERYLVVNELSDSISLIDLKPLVDLKSVVDLKQVPKHVAIPKKAVATDRTKGNGYGYRKEDQIFSVRHLKLGSSPKPGAAERGEAHFFDARLSLGGWYSCHSCHADGHSSGGLADTFGDGDGGSPKRILSLLGVAQTGPWSWLGNKKHLKNQVHQSLRLTMRGRKLAENDVNDLVEFIKTLKPPPPYQPATSVADRAIVAKGLALFASLDCNSCHKGRTLTSPDSYDVGLTDELGTKRFNPPSLRGVGHRYRLFHDNRAENVEDVVRGYKHQLPRVLSAQEQRVLIRYLKSL